MALTPEEIVNKRFQHTKFREGYDQDEVDDFLDQIVLEMRRLLIENADLTENLTSPSTQSIEKIESDQTGSTQTVDASPVVPPSESTFSSHGLLELARKLHDEHVQDGLAKRDQMIRDGQESAARLIRDAEAQAADLMGRLEIDRKKIEITIDDLREFEHDYRSSLREFIESQLTELLHEEFIGEPLEAASQVLIYETANVEAEVEVELEGDDEAPEAQVGERS
jgi:DivIVA domain-containing protein